MIWLIEVNGATVCAATDRYEALDVGRCLEADCPGIVWIVRRCRVVDCVGVC